MANITVFATQNRAAGDYTSATAQYGGSPVVVSYAIQSTAAHWGTTVNPNITINVVVQQNLNDGAGWTEVFGFPCNPGELDKNGNPPSGSFTVNDQDGARSVQVVMSITGGAVNFGLTASDAPYTG